MRYKIADANKVGKDLTDTHYAASEVVASVLSGVLPTDRPALEKLRTDLITFSAGHYVPKPPTEVLTTLLGMVSNEQDRLTENTDHSNPAATLAEHTAFAFVTDWLESFGLNVAPIRCNELSAKARAELEAAADAEQEAANRAAQAAEVYDEAEAAESPEAVAKTLIQVFGSGVKAIESLGYSVEKKGHFWYVYTARMGDFAGGHTTAEEAARVALILHARKQGA